KLVLEGLAPVIADPVSGPITADLYVAGNALQDLDGKVSGQADRLFQATLRVWRHIKQRVEDRYALAKRAAYLKDLVASSYYGSAMHQTSQDNRVIRFASSFQTTYSHSRFRPRSAPATYRPTPDRTAHAAMAIPVPVESSYDSEDAFYEELAQ